MESALEYLRTEEVLNSSLSDTLFWLRADDSILLVPAIQVSLVFIYYGFGGFSGMVLAVP